MVVHTFNPGTWKAEAVRILGQPRSTKQVPGQLGLLHRETLSENKNLEGLLII
ncbi:hypothetical protein I79_022651 [Cricetulus griseus]|uniref:Uncharacterized protein n=1 Tax=Cricetulus griseus TaxID=10029 RepID=G3IFX6_CRIGR|nr:hypothetical protein I79_022651 [Cricetulus griseus]